MKPTTTPNGATLSYHEVGDTLQDNDVYETMSGAFVVGDPKSPARGMMPVGRVMNGIVAEAYRPRRYLPKEES